ncbi:hypothetical protein OHN05_19245 [Serratia marcescens]|uniref:hypothetical protein n=1 Tax=Serratia marcescens TaxID=615 RepID=UPI00057779A3|nr:hypothetical protein [Serratia marcescens]MDM3540556.1 hypothetical protein [Serratia marcescens]
MDSKTISCPFCFTQSPHGVRICKGCHAKVAYGESPLSVAFLFQFVAFLFQFVAFGLAWLVFSLTGSTPVSVITFFASVIILICIIKKKYADRVVFIR